MEFLKHFWELAITVISASLSFMFYKHQQNQKKSESLTKAVHQHETKLEVFDEQLNSITEDISEIKADVKTLIYKLLGSTETPTTIRRSRRK